MRTLPACKIGALRLAVLAAALLPASMLPGAALAQSDGGAEHDAAIRRGTDLRRKGDDGAALVEFQKAVTLRETPRALAQLGLAEQALGLWLDANGHLSRALSANGDAWIEKNRQTLEAARTTIQSHLAEVEVWGTPKGAQVRFDGVLAGALPLARAWVGTGEVSMLVTAPEHAPLTRLLAIPAPTRSREHVQLRPLTASAAAGTGTATAAGAGVGTTVGGAGAALDLSATDAGGLPPAASTMSGPIGPDSQGPGRGTQTQTSDGAASATPLYKRWWFWAGVSAVAVGTGVTIYLLGRDSATNGAMCALPPCDRF